MNVCCHTVFIFWRCFGIEINDLQINDGIKEREVRLIGENGEQLGVFQTFKAVEMANSQYLDLVKIAGKVSPPVCKIMDYGKYKFELDKKNKEIRTKSRAVKNKEIRISYTIDSNDLETKVGHAKKFLESGNKVKVSLRFRGREAAHSSIAEEIMIKFAKGCSEFAIVEKMPTIDNRNMFMFLTPIKKK